MVSVVLLLLALFLAPIIGGGFGELTNSILQILVFGAIISYFIIPRGRHNTWLRVPGFIPLAAFLAIVVISGIFGEVKYLGIKQILFVLAGLGAYIIAAALGRNVKTAAGVVWGVVVSALGICVISIRDYAITTGGGAQFWKSLLSSGDHMRLFGTFINPGYFAGFLVIALPVTLGVYLVTRKSSLIMVAGIGFVVELMAMMLTGTKFGIISAVGALIVFFGLSIATGALRRAMFKRLIIIAIIVTPLLVLFSMPVKSRIVAAEEGGSQVHSTTFRVYTWKATINMIKDNPLLGVGAGSFDAAYPRYTIAGPTKYAHESYLQIASESGVFALGALLAAIMAIAVACLMSVVKNRHDAAVREGLNDTSAFGPELTWNDLIPLSGWRLINCAIFGALVGSALRNIADSDWYVIGIWLPFWILTGVLAAQSGAAGKAFAPARVTKNALLSVGILVILLSASLGMGDLFASGVLSSDQASNYRKAIEISPLNPDYYRELAKNAAYTKEDAGRNINIAIRLAPKEGVNYFARGLSKAQEEPRSAINDFKTAIKYNPHATQALYRLAQAYTEIGDTKHSESTYRRLIAIEDSPYEQIKGAPELVDTTYAYAHVYFGEKYLAEKNYTLAISEYNAAIDRLERWRSNDQIMQMARVTGLLHPEEEKQLLEMLRDSYYNLAQAYDGSNKKTEAANAEKRAGRIQRAIDKLNSN